MGQRETYPRSWTRCGRCAVNAALALLTCAAIVPSRLAARSLEEALISTFPRGLREEADDLARVFASTVAASFPVTGTSASFVYRLDPATDSLRRLDIPLGPVFSERAETAGERRFSVGLNYAVATYDAINGHNLDSLVSVDPRKSGNAIGIGDARFFEPVAVIARLDLEAQILMLSGTYGLTPDLDVNLFVPLVRTFLRASTTIIAPDPRVPPEPDFLFVTDSVQKAETDEGIGDLLLRLKYALPKLHDVDLAAGLTLSLPSGSRSSFHSTGDTQLGAALYASGTYRQRVQPHCNLAFVLNTDKFDRSQGRYAAGLDLRLAEWLTLNNDFIGRSDVTRPDTVARPAFVQIERADVLQFSTGLKVAPWQRTVLFFNTLLPLNEAGVRADEIFTVGIEGVF